MIILVDVGKGGNGKSYISQNLATYLEIGKMTIWSSIVTHKTY
jgi:MinD-like ATPase involved in chromosome partitioning or flagellar assembly